MPALILLWTASRDVCLDINFDGIFFFPFFSLSLLYFIYNYFFLFFRLHIKKKKKICSEENSSLFSADTGIKTNGHLEMLFSPLFLRSYWVQILSHRALFLQHFFSRISHHYDLALSRLASSKVGSYSINLIAIFVHIVPVYLFRNRQKVSELLEFNTIYDSTFLLLFYFLIFHKHLHNIYPLSNSQLIGLSAFYLCCAAAAAAASCER